MCINVYIHISQEEQGCGFQKVLSSVGRVFTFNYTQQAGY
jgi:hypothetical protein